MVNDEVVKKLCRLSVGDLYASSQVINEWRRVLTSAQVSVQYPGDRELTAFVKGFSFAASGKQALNDKVTKLEADLARAEANRTSGVIMTPAGPMRFLPDR